MARRAGRCSAQSPRSTSSENRPRAGTGSQPNHSGGTTMRILGMLRADESSEAGVAPRRELIEKMGEFVEEITRAGVMLATDGLQPSSKGKRVRLANGKFTVIDGPFTESKELIASYALFQV